MGEHLTLADITEQPGEDTSFITRCETAGLLESSAADGFELRSGRQPAVERSTDPVCGMQLAE